MLFGRPFAVNLNQAATHNTRHSAASADHRVRKTNAKFNLPWGMRQGVAGSANFLRLTGSRWRPRDFNETQNGGRDRIIANQIRWNRSSKISIAAWAEFFRTA